MLFWDFEILDWGVSWLNPEECEDSVSGQELELVYDVCYVSAKYAETAHMALNTQQRTCKEGVRLTMAAAIVAYFEGVGSWTLT